MRITRKPWLFAIVYVALSLGIEASLIIFGGLRVPQNNAQIAPIILTIPPILAALITGYRQLKAFLIIVMLTAVLTLVVTLTFIKITGISTGFVEPIINRSIAGLLAAIITNRLVRKQKDAEAT
ncbi:MAG: hypothetical protein ACE5NW_07680 [Acidiferrobacterales bacterium]